jgi:hypothetical protein
MIQVFIIVTLVSIVCSYLLIRKAELFSPIMHDVTVTLITVAAITLLLTLTTFR